MFRQKKASTEAAITGLKVSTFRIPTATPSEQDGTADWDHTTLVVVEASVGNTTGLGYSYADTGTARLIDDLLRAAVEGNDALSPNQVRRDMLNTIRNHGREGVGAMAISAVDAALWDLKARLLELPLVTLLGQGRPAADLYASGGFTNYTEAQLLAQLETWKQDGFRAVKMKVGRDPAADERRVKLARRVLGPDIELYVDANGAWAPKQALRMAEVFAEVGVVWFEEPVSSDDLEGLQLLRGRAPAKMDIVAGEYGYHPQYFRRMLEAGAVDVMMADATRCLGISGFLSVAAVCDAFGVALSAHCAPALHLHPCLSIPRYRRMEYFFDHCRIEKMLFEGAVQAKEGRLHPDLSRPGLGLELKRKDAARYAI